MRISDWVSDRCTCSVFFGGMAACYLLVAFVVAVLVTSLGLTTPVSGAALGVLLWLAVTAVGMTAHLAGDKPIGMYLIGLTFLMFGHVLAEVEGKLIAQISKREIEPTPLEVLTLQVFGILSILASGILYFYLV